VLRNTVRAEHRATQQSKALAEIRAIRARARARVRVPAKPRMTAVSCCVQLSVVVCSWFI